mmetsp:Transcript_1249/g.3896  ORF Transcript_1249/g.3896 Transcript_1249/m.3896 type:complete len:89 (+) Transcript_1249:1980-2246(+)
MRSVFPLFLSFSVSFYLLVEAPSLPRSTFYHLEMGQGCDGGGEALSLQPPGDGSLWRDKTPLDSTVDNTVVHENLADLLQRRRRQKVH